MPHIHHPTEGSSLADVLELVLDKGVVIAGDIRIKLVEIELLTISIRLLISSVDRAREIGIDWWSHSTFLCPQPHTPLPAPDETFQSDLSDIKARLERIEQKC